MTGDEAKEQDPEFHERMVVKAMAFARDSSTPLVDLTWAADTLVAYGALDEADAAIERIEREAPALKGVGRLKAVSRHLRRGGILSSLHAVGGDRAESFSGPKEALVFRNDKQTNRVIVVFTGKAKRFWLSLKLLHQFLRIYDAHIIYLTDYSRHMYFNGLPRISPGYDATLRLVADAINELGAEKTFVLANSGGGFIGLRTAADLAIESFLGLSIRTDYSPGSRLPRRGQVEGRMPRNVDEKLRIDLRPYLAGKKYPRRALLLCGDSNQTDVAHAGNLRGLPNFEIQFLPKCGRHDIVSVLLARGQFESVLTRFMGADGIIGRGSRARTAS